MRTRPLRATPVVLALMSFAPDVASAQVIPSPYTFVETKQELGAVVGAADFGKGRFGFGPGSGLLAGARWSINLSGPLGFEVQAASATGQRDVVDPGRDPTDRVVGQADFQLALVDARLSFTLTGARTWRGLAPFLFAGGGMAFDLAGEDPADEPLLPVDRFDYGNTFLATFGAGSRYFLSDRLVLRGDAMFTLNKLDTPPGFSDPERGFEAVEESEWVGGLHLTITAALRF